MGVDLEIWPSWSNGAHCHPHLHALRLSVTAFLLMVPEQLRGCVFMKAFFLFNQPSSHWESISFEFESNKRKCVLGTTGSRII